MFLQLYNTTKQFKDFSSHKWAFSSSFYDLEEKIKNDYWKNKKYWKFVYASSWILYIPNKFFYDKQLVKIINDNNYKWFNKLRDFCEKEKIPYQILFKDIVLDYDNPIYNENFIDNTKKDILTEIDVKEIIENFFININKFWQKKKIFLFKDVIKELKDNWIYPFKVFLTKNIAWFNNFQITIRFKEFVPFEDILKMKKYLKDFFDISVLNPSQLRLYESNEKSKRRIGFKVFGTTIYQTNYVINKYKNWMSTNYIKLLSFFKDKKFCSWNNMVSLREKSYNFILKIIEEYYLWTKINYFCFKTLKEILWIDKEDSIRKVYFLDRKVEALSSKYFKVIHTKIVDKEIRDKLMESIKEFENIQIEKYSKIKKLFKKYKDKRWVSLYDFFNLYTWKNIEEYKKLSTKDKVKFRNVFQYYKKWEEEKTFLVQKKNKERNTNWFKTLLKSNENILEKKDIFLEEFFTKIIENSKKWIYKKNNYTLSKIKKRTKVVFNSFSYYNIYKKLENTIENLKKIWFDDEKSMEDIQILFSYWLQTMSKWLFYYVKNWWKKKEQKEKKEFLPKEQNIEKYIMDKLSYNFHKNFYAWNRYNTLTYSLYYIKSISKIKSLDANHLLNVFENKFSEYIGNYNKDNNNNYTNIRKILIT